MIASDLQLLQQRMAAAVMRPLTGDEQMRKSDASCPSIADEAAAFIRPNDRLTSFERLEIYNRQYWFRLFSSFEEDFPGLKSVVGSRKFEALMRAYLEATSRDTVRSKSFTGKPCRMLKNDWTEAWDRDDTPDPLPMPLQMMVAIDAVGATHRYPEQAKDIAFNPCGQIVGRATKVRKVRDVIFELAEEYAEAVDRLTDTARV